MLDAIIDKLTRSIEQRATGRVLDTEVRSAAVADLRSLESTWQFDWQAELEVAEVYELVIPEHGSYVHGLISLARHPGYVLVNLLESSPRNVGETRSSLVCRATSSRLLRSCRSN